jgi:hypothetical protein
MVQELMSLEDSMLASLLACLARARSSTGAPGHEQKLLEAVQ